MANNSCTSPNPCSWRTEINKPHLDVIGDIPGGLRFKRAALIIGDLDRSLALYRDALGFTLQSIKQSPSDSYSYEIFSVPASSRLRMAALDGPLGQERTLALIEVIPLARNDRAPRAAMVIEVANIDRAVAAASDVPGVIVLSERTLFTHDGRQGREVGLIDPDGHAVVLYNV